MELPTPAFLHDGPDDGPVLVLAHGAGAPMDSAFMSQMAQMLAQNGIHVVRFEFAYMAARRADGKKRPPSRMPGLIEEFRQVMAELGPGPLFIGGKSMGGRVASMVAADPVSGDGVAGLVCLGYPFHPPGKPQNLRTQHLSSVRCSGLIVQGERDPFGGVAEVAAYQLPERLTVFWSAAGNHDLVPPKRSGISAETSWSQAARAVSGFIRDNS